MSLNFAVKGPMCNGHVLRQGREDEGVREDTIDSMELEDRSLFFDTATIQFGFLIKKSTVQLLNVCGKCRHSG